MKKFNLAKTSTIRNGEEDRTGQADLSALLNI